LKGTILYIGKAKNLKSRVQQYFSKGSVWKQEMVAIAETVEFIEVSSESDALTLEENLIKQHLPEYNRLLKYNSNHTFVKFTREDFPAVTLSRTRYKDRATYIGPKQNTKELRKLLQYLRQIFKYRTTSSTEFQKGVLTTDFYLGLDAGWSIIAKMKQKHGDIYIQQAEQLGFKLEKSYEAYKDEYKAIIKTMQEFFDGNTKTILTYVEKEIMKAASKQQFERCAQLRDMYRYIETLSEKQEVVFSRPVTGNVIHIEQIHSYWVVIFVKFFEGKIIDIIRERKLVEDGDLDSLVASCKAEFGVTNISGSPKYSESSVFLTNLDRVLNKSEHISLDSLLEKFVQSYISSTLFEEDNLINQLLIGLKERYNLSKVPFHIECIDISHLSGGWISGGLSCFKSGIPYPKGYRRYKIQTV
jgi:excinuclease ABC subunit C